MKVVEGPTPQNRLPVRFKCDIQKKRTKIERRKSAKGQWCETSVGMAIKGAISA